MNIGHYPQVLLATYDLIIANYYLYEIHGNINIYIKNPLTIYSTICNNLLLPVTFFPPSA